MSLEERLEYAAMKARHEKKLRPWYKKWWGRLSLIIIGLILVLAIVAGLYIKEKIKEIQRTEAQQSLINQQQLYQRTIAGNGSNYFLGTANEPLVTIIEFSDFACPFCQQSVAGLKKAAEQYPDKIKIVFRDYPLHENSVELALAARCAGEQNKFWEMHDLLFTNQDQLTVSGTELTSALETIAASLKLNSDQFASCRETQKYLDQIRQDFEDGEKLQIDGTPTWFINEGRLTGYLPEETFLKLTSGLINK